MAMITLIEYAKRHNKIPRNLRFKAMSGGFKTAVKMGRDWIIDEDEPNIDRRITDGKMIGYRRKKAETEKTEETE